MDKVIIDGVDVSECEHYRAEIETKMPYGEYETLKDKCHYSGIEIIQDCKGNKGCIYKQLKRLQAEYDNLHLNYAGCKTANTGLQELNQKLQAENDNLKDDIDKQQLYVDSLEQENERLKARLRPLEDSYFKGLSSIEIAGLAKKSIRITAENRKLEDALQEIRDIANKHDYWRGSLQSATNIINEIIAKINEVIGAE